MLVGRPSSITSLIEEVVRGRRGRSSHLVLELLLSTLVLVRNKFVSYRFTRLLVVLALRSDLGTVC